MSDENERLEHLYSHCLQDRLNVINKGQNSWIRRCGIDLLCKLLYLLLNSVGIRNSTKCLYVDEVNNSNMCGNLNKTAMIVHGKDATFLRMHSIDREGHFKTGITWTIAELFKAIFFSIPAIFGYIASPKEVNESLLKILLFRMSQYVSRISRDALCVLMSDHHFYSTIVAETHNNSIVLQHGLVQDIRFFSPVRASAICCWSAKSVKIIDSKRGVDVGTYKFEIRRNVDRAGFTIDKIARVLVCLSSSKTIDQIRFRMEPIISLKKRYGFTVLIKTHPGSFFSLSDLDSYQSMSGIELYKEEKIEDLDFDFAFVEQSTAVLDIACLGIPFIICDENESSYFTEYKKVIPTSKQQTDVIQLFETFNYELAFDGIRKLVENEINSGHCILGEYILDRCKENIDNY